MCMCMCIVTVSPFHPPSPGQVINMLFPVYRRGTAWDLIEQHTREAST